MNKQLHRLITYHNRTVRESYYGTDIERLSKELLEVVKKIEKVGRDELTNTDREDLRLTETSKYRYTLLPKLFSDIKDIYSSPKLKRYLINYYLKNRRKEGMQRRSYGRRTEQVILNNHLSADYFIHRMYIELGQVMYFSLLDDLKHNLKNKWIEMREKLTEIYKQINTYFRVLATKIANRASFKHLLGVITGAFIEALSIVPQIAKSSPLSPLHIGVSLVFGTMLTVVSMLTSALIVLDAKEDKDNNSELDEEIKIIVRSQLHAYGYDVIKSIMMSLTLVLPDDYQVEHVEDLIPLAHKLTYSIRDKYEFARILLGIIQKLNESGLANQILKCFRSIEGFGELIKKANSIEKVSIRIKYYISSVIKDAINNAAGNIFKVPDEITLQEVVRSGKDLVIDHNEFIKPGGENLPGLIDMLTLLTSHYILIEADVNDGTTQVKLAFDAKEYLNKFSEVKIGEIGSFVKSYLKYYGLFVEQTKDQKTSNQVVDRNVLINV
jgi:hypothetical protein